MISGPHIFLCGFMGSGKTTHGKRLARLLKRRFIDLDKEIETSQQKDISQIFSEQGEDAFRRLETAQLQQVIASPNPAVISLGGGTPCFNNNIELILRQGILVYIKMDEKALYQRVVRSKKSRPLLLNKSREELVDYIHELVNKREPFYSRAQLTLNGLNLKTEDMAQSLQTYLSNS